MKRYFFFDIDGTLTTPLTADYPDSAREAVRRLQEKGNFVAIASGRLQADAVDFIIFLNGSLLLTIVLVNAHITRSL